MSPTPSSLIGPAAIRLVKMSLAVIMLTTAALLRYMSVSSQVLTAEETVHYSAGGTYSTDLQNIAEALGESRVRVVLPVCCPRADTHHAILRISSPVLKDVLARVQIQAHRKIDILFQGTYKQVPD
jgi:hypothetical protein